MAAERAVKPPTHAQISRMGGPRIVLSAFIRLELEHCSIVLNQESYLQLKIIEVPAQQPTFVPLESCQVHVPIGLQKKLWVPSLLNYWIPNFHWSRLGLGAFGNSLRKPLCLGLLCFGKTSRHLSDFRHKRLTLHGLRQATSWMKKVLLFFRAWHLSGRRCHATAPASNSNTCSIAYPLFKQQQVGY